jgi:hypothetical protein
MIDLNTYKQMHPEAVEQHDIDHSGLENATVPPEDNFLLLLPSTVPGYGFHNKKWSEFQLLVTAPDCD